MKHKTRTSKQNKLFHWDKKAFNINIVTNFMNLLGMYKLKSFLMIQHVLWDEGLIQVTQVWLIASVMSLVVLWNYLGIVEINKVKFHNRSTRVASRIESRTLRNFFEYNNNVRTAAWTCRQSPMFHYYPLLMVKCHYARIRNVTWSFIYVCKHVPIK